MNPDHVIHRLREFELDPTPPPAPINGGTGLVVRVCAQPSLSLPLWPAFTTGLLHKPRSLLFARRWGPSTTFVQSDLVTSLMDHLVACLMVSVVCGSSRGAYA